MKLHKIVYRIFLSRNAMWLTFVILLDWWWPLLSDWIFFFALDVHVHYIRTEYCTIFIVDDANIQCICGRYPCRIDHVEIVKMDHCGSLWTIVDQVIDEIFVFIDECSSLILLKMEKKNRTLECHNGHIYKCVNVYRIIIIPRFIKSNNLFSLLVLFFSCSDTFFLLFWIWFWNLIISREIHFGKCIK